MNTAIAWMIFNLLLGLNPICDVTVLNRGKGGNNIIDLMKRMESDVISENPDLVVLMVGTNDMLNPAKRISGARFSSLLDSIIHIMKSNQISLVLASPPPVDTIYLFERHNRMSYARNPNESLYNISQILRTKSLQHQLTFVDLYQYFHSKGIPIHNDDMTIRNEKNSGAKDGVHPTSLGYEEIGNVIFKKLLEDGRIKRKVKIICLGDSITWGAKMAGAGTETGETYPAYLRGLICKYLQDN